MTEAKRGRGRPKKSEAPEEAPKKAPEAPATIEPPAPPTPRVRNLTREAMIAAGMSEAEAFRVIPD